MYVAAVDVWNTERIDDGSPARMPSVGVPAAYAAAGETGHCAVPVWLGGR